MDAKRGENWPFFVIPGASSNWLLIKVINGQGRAEMLKLRLIQLRGHFRPIGEWKITARLVSEPKPFCINQHHKRGAFVLVSKRPKGPISFVLAAAQAESSASDCFNTKKLQMETTDFFVCFSDPKNIWHETSASKRWLHWHLKSEILQCNVKKTPNLTGMNHCAKTC